MIVNLITASQHKQNVMGQIKVNVGRECKGFATSEHYNANLYGAAENSKKGL